MELCANVLFEELKKELISQSMKTLPIYKMC